MFSIGDFVQHITTTNGPRMVIVAIDTGIGDGINPDNAVVEYYCYQTGDFRQSQFPLTRLKPYNNG